MMQTTCQQAYMPQATPSASAVNIQIFEPKAYAGQPQQSVANPIYSYPTQSAYTMPYVNQYQQYMPQQPAAQFPQYAQPVEQYQPQQIPSQYPVYQPTGEQYNLQQNITPQYAQTIETQPVPQQQMPAPAISPEPQPAPAQEAQQSPELNVTEPQQEQAPVDVNSLVAGLQSPDTAAQEQAITEIAKLSQDSDPAKQSAVLSEPVMNGLAAVAGQDTSGLQGPTEAQIAAVNKAASGAQLTPEEEALVQNPAPKTAADTNKAIAMFTLAMLQKNQRDEIDRYNQTQDTANQLPQININDLIGFNEIKNAATSTNPADKESKLAALQALSYAARPEDKAVIEPIVTPALQDSEPLIQQSASELLNAIGSQSAPAQQGSAAASQQPQDTSKLSRKERKAAEKAQKEAGKQAKVA